MVKENSKTERTINNKAKKLAEKNNADDAVFVDNKILIESTIANIFSINKLFINSFIFINSFTFFIIIDDLILSSFGLSLIIGLNISFFVIESIL